MWTLSGIIAGGLVGYLYGGGNAGKGAALGGAIGFVAGTVVEVSVLSRSAPPQVGASRPAAPPPQLF
jgi:uncharacterized protein YcfJ